MHDISHPDQELGRIYWHNGNTGLQTRELCHTTGTGIWFSQHSAWDGILLKSLYTYLCIVTLSSLSYVSVLSGLTRSSMSNKIL